MSPPRWIPSAGCSASGSSRPPQLAMPAAGWLGGFGTVAPGRHRRDWQLRRRTGSPCRRGWHRGRRGSRRTGRTGACRAIRSAGRGQRCAGGAVRPGPRRAGRRRRCRGSDPGADGRPAQCRRRAHPDQRPGQGSAPTGPDDLLARFTRHTPAALVTGLASPRPRPGHVAGDAVRVALRNRTARAVPGRPARPPGRSRSSPWSPPAPRARSPCTGSARAPWRRRSSRPAITPGGSAARRPGRTCAASPRSPRPAGKSPATGTAPGRGADAGPASWAAEEAVRDLVRVRAALLADRKRAQQRLTAMPLRHGRVWRSGSAWTWAHEQWIAGQRFEEPRWPRRWRITGRGRVTRRAELDAIEAELAPVGRPETARRTGGAAGVLPGHRRAAQPGPGRRGRRGTFPVGESLHGLYRPVPGEYSSGDKTRRGSITKRVPSRAHRSDRGRLVLPVQARDRRHVAPPGRGAEPAPWPDPGKRNAGCTPRTRRRPPAANRRGGHRGRPRARRLRLGRDDQLTRAGRKAASCDDPRGHDRAHQG